MRLRLVRTSGFAAAILLLVVCSCAPAPSGPPNIVLIVIDTLRPDHLPFHGYQRDTAPFLAELATKGVVFEHVQSTSSWTAPATASLLTSLHPVQHGVHSGLTAVRTQQQADPTITLNRIPSEVATAAEILKAGGYSTWGVADNLNICSELGFEQGFDHFRMTSDVGAAAVNATVRGWRNGIEEEGPYFLYLHYMDPHRPYLKRAPWYTPRDGELLDSISAYDSEISHVDRKIEELFELLRWDENTLIIVTSDHGEEFQDHGGWDHGRTLYAEVVDVPLVVYSSAVGCATTPAVGSSGAAVSGAAADQASGGIRRVMESVSILDVLPTMRDAAGLSVGEAEQGVSLLPVITGEADAPAGRSFHAELRSPPWFGSLTLHSVTRERQKYILTLPDAEELFDLTRDPEERESLVDRRRDAVTAFRAELAEFLESVPRYAAGTVDISLDAETREQLESLGYMQ